jgi:hypothetical protein
MSPSPGIGANAANTITDRSGRGMRRWSDGHAAHRGRLRSRPRSRCKHHEGPWRSDEDVALATLSWVHWFNNNRVQQPLPEDPSLNNCR